MLDNLQDIEDELAFGQQSTVSPMDTGKEKQ